MGFLLVLVLFVFVVSPLVIFAGNWAGYNINSWQLCVLRAVGLIALIHIFQRPYQSISNVASDILLFFLLDFFLRKFLSPPK